MIGEREGCCEGDGRKERERESIEMQKRIGRHEGEIDGRRAKREESAMGRYRVKR